MAKGPLAGIPFAAKDIFATATLPTTYGSPHYAGFQAGADAAVIQLLKDSGALLLGKTSTVEFASVGAIPPTRNPWDLDRSPGGSSAGSGAAVGAGLVPLALASQTGGSTIRPAAFCGAVGYKPTWGRISTEGMKPFAPSLDTVGLIASHVRLLRHVAVALGFGAPLPVRTDRPLRIGWFPTPYAEDMEEASRNALDRARAVLREAGHEVVTAPVPDGGDTLNEWQNIVMHGEGRYSYQADRLRFGDRLHPGLLACADNALGIRPRDLTTALDAIADLRPRYDDALREFDAWLTPAVPGEAPAWSPEDSGSAVFNRLFTALHVPCVCLPAGFGPNGLPLAVQLVAARDRDQPLLAVAGIVETLLRQAEAR
jgi:Asp-tRNA(Asn)/Glu-tRNA(Gln) amidotransferase A subunit family amidase